MVDITFIYHCNILLLITIREDRYRYKEYTSEPDITALDCTDRQEQRGKVRTRKDHKEECVRQSKNVEQIKYDLENSYIFRNYKVFHNCLDFIHYSLYFRIRYPANVMLTGWTATNKIIK